MIITKDGNLLEADTDYIVQQNCCTAMRPHGLSEIIAKVWPTIDPYSSKKRLLNNWSTVESRPTPGTIAVYRNAAGPDVICAFAQYTHGKPGVYCDPARTSVPDDAAARLRYFKQCLVKIAELSPTSVGFPYRIGCGLAGGNWKDYTAALQEWSEENPGICVVIYKIE
jgi:hypothetical protein